MNATVETSAPVRIHVQTWSGSGSGTITEMQNAGKRGKRCRTIHFQGWNPSSWDGEYRTINNVCGHIHRWVENLPTSTDYDVAADSLKTLVEEGKRSLPTLGVHLHLTEETIKGIDAPVPVLTAGREGYFSAGADRNGVHIYDCQDQHNLPAMITSHHQTENQAYRLAAKVWEQVKLCQTFHEAGDVLSAAGCRLHYYCRMD